MPGAGAEEEKTEETSEGKEIREAQEGIIDELMQVRGLLNEGNLQGAFEMFENARLKKESASLNPGGNEGLENLYESVKAEIDQKKDQLKPENLGQVAA